MTYFVRKLLLACLPLLLIATWALPAQAASGHQPRPAPLCVVHSNPSMVESGEFATESSIADVVQVECQPRFSQQTVTIDASQLFNACHGTLFWFSAPTGGIPGVPQITLPLDNDGNATAFVIGGPSCAPVTTEFFASLNAPPFPTAMTTFTILPPQNTPSGVTASPRREVEDGVFSSAPTVVQVEFPSSQAERFVTIKSDELAARCGGGFVWVTLGPTVTVGPEVTVQLDNNGNAFAVGIGVSCASGTSTITADLDSVPFTTHSTTFTILSPRPTI